MIIRDATPDDLPAITRIYADSVLGGVASYELVTPDEGEMGRRMAAITGDGYPYLAAQSEDAVLLGYAYASPFRTRPAYRWLVEDSDLSCAPESPRQGALAGGALLAEIDRPACEKPRLPARMVAVIGGRAHSGRPDRASPEGRGFLKAPG